MDDLGTKLGIALEFLKGIKSELMNIDKKLNTLSMTVSNMHSDLKRLTGRPMIEVYKDWVEREKQAASKLPDKGTLLRASSLLLAKR